MKANDQFDVEIVFPNEGGVREKIIQLSTTPSRILFEARGKTETAFRTDKSESGSPSLSASVDCFLDDVVKMQILSAINETKLRVAYYMETEEQLASSLILGQSTLRRLAASNLSLELIVYLVDDAERGR